MPESKEKTEKCKGASKKMNVTRGKIAAGAFLILLLSCVMTGCGRQSIDVMEEIEVSFNGVDGYGTADVLNTYKWEDAAYEAMAGGDEADFSVMEAMTWLEGAVSFELSPKENLSNGDEVTVTAVVDNDTAKEYDLALKGGEKKFTVEGLQEPQELDLFENIDVQFNGIAPYITASINYGSVSVDADYSIDKTTDLSPGDTVTVTATYDEEGLIQKGYLVNADTKEYVVPESAKYVTQLSEIPEKTIDKMNRQFEDAMRAYVANNWVEAESLKSIDYVGNYLLTAKTGVDVDNKNIYYGVYKLSISSGENEFSYYIYCTFWNLMLLPDGTCSVDLTDYSIPEVSVDFWGEVQGEGFKSGDYYYAGYEDLDSLFHHCVTKNIEWYKYEAGEAAN